jgi:septal ring factor EnvC (AmiA/AmiB activator)
MMGGGHMMGYGQGYSNPWSAPYLRPGTSYQNEYSETKRLREEIHQKRQELSELYRAEKPDKNRIDQKIKELSRLEADLDQKMSGR